MRDLGREESRMRHDAHGQLTDNQAAEMDTRQRVQVKPVDRPAAPLPRRRFGVKLRQSNDTRLSESLPASGLSG